MAGRDGTATTQAPAGRGGSRSLGSGDSGAQLNHPSQFSAVTPSVAYTSSLSATLRGSALALVASKRLVTYA